MSLCGPRTSSRKTPPVSEGTVGPARARTVRCTRRETTTTAAAALRAWEGSGARAMRRVGLGRIVRWSAPPVRNATARARPTTAARAARANTRGVARSPAFATPGGPRTRPARAANARPVTTDRRANSAPTLRIPHATRDSPEQGRAPATTAHRRGFGAMGMYGLLQLSGRAVAVALITSAGTVCRQE